MRARIFNLLALVEVFAYWLVRGSARNTVKNPSKILVVQTGKLGDAVCTTPIFRAIKKSFPSCRVVVAGNRVNGEVLAGNPDIDHYIVYTKNIIAMAREFKRQAVDFACLTTPNFSALAALYLAGIPAIAAPKIFDGWSPYETRSYRLLLKLVVDKPHRMGHYAPREYLRLLEPVGIFSQDTTKHLAFSEDARRKIEELFKGWGIDPKKDFLVCVSPSAGNRIKSWGGKNFARLIERLHQAYPEFKFVLIGAGKDAQDVQEMMQSLDKNVPIINTFDMINIDELKALMSKMNLFISVDTGPIYIAEAFNVPTVDITGPIDENEQPPIGRLHKIVVPKYRKGPELRVMNARNYDEQEVNKQLASISVDMVIGAIDECLLALKNK